MRCESVSASGSPSTTSSAATAERRRKLSTSSLIASGSEMRFGETTLERADKGPQRPLDLLALREQLVERRVDRPATLGRNRILELAAQIVQAEADHGQVLHRPVMDVGGEAQQATPEALRKRLGALRGSGIGILQR